MKFDALFVSRGSLRCFLLNLALHVAVAEDQLEIVKHLVSNGALLNLQEKKNRFTPLMLCLAQQPPHFEEIFAAILKGKPDLSVQDSAGQTILHLATRTCMSRTLRALVEITHSLSLYRSFRVRGAGNVGAGVESQTEGGRGGLEEDDGTARGGGERQPDHCATFGERMTAR